MRITESRIRQIVREELNEVKRIRMVSADVVGLYFVCKELGDENEELGYERMIELVQKFADENHPELKLRFFDRDEVHFEGADQFLVEGPEDALPGFVKGIKRVLYDFITEDGGIEMEDVRKIAIAKRAVNNIRLHDTIHDL
jgi:hypothetical protein